jgi:hypothetical protein
MPEGISDWMSRDGFYRFWWFHRKLGTQSKKPVYCRYWFQIHVGTFQHKNPKEPKGWSYDGRIGVSGTICEQYGFFDPNDRNRYVGSSTSFFNVTRSGSSVTITGRGGRAQGTWELGDILPTVLYPTKQALLDATYSILYQAMHRFCDFFSGDFNENPGKSRISAKVREADSEPNYDEMFLFNEPLVHVQGIPYVGKLGYWYNWLVEHAYLEALQSVPKLNDNSISNVIEIVGFIKSLVVDHKVEFPSRLQDLWLQYRYVYNTTKLDVSEAISFAKRYMSLGSLNRKLKCYGMSTTTVNDILVTCRCTLNIEPTDLGYVDKIWRALTTYGLSPDFYVIWDMIPYSFIVDWFIPVGDMLSVFDANSEYSSRNYTISDVCLSLSYEVPTPDGNFKCYSRWRADPLKTFNEFYWLDKPRTSDKVKIFRVFDAVSLIMG